LSGAEKLLQSPVSLIFPNQGVNVSAKPEVGDASVAAKPANSKKMLIIGLVVVLVLALGGGGAFFYISKQRAAAEEGDDAAPAKAAAHARPKTAPAYLPLDNMVVNLSDPGGERVAQVGITLEVLDAHAADTVKAFMPTIRSGVLMLISQRTSEELLTPEGKQKLAKDILREASLPFGGGDDEPTEAAAPAKKKKSAKSSHADMPVVNVLFSSFIVQ
jgi:flagellar FliL protein